MPAPVQPAKNLKNGVYCLANDEVLEWFQAFVRSFRHFNPELPLTVIPYNHSVKRLKDLESQFNFTVMSESAAAMFDGIAERVAGQRVGAGTLRKLCCFTGEYDTFFFLDSDIVVTMCFDRLFQAFEQASFDFVYFDTDITKVYKLEYARKMLSEYHSPGFNSGAFISRRASVIESEIMVAVESGGKVRDNFSLWGDQPFLNYLMDVNRRRMAHAYLLLPEITITPHGRIPVIYNPQTDQYLDTTDRLMPFVHWPGSEYPTMINPGLFLKFRMLGMTGWERLVYQWEFYYRRTRRQVRNAMEKSALFSGWVARRDERIRQKRLRAITKN